MTPIRVADLDVNVVERGDVDADFTAVFLHAAHVDHRMAQAAFEPVVGARVRWRRLYLDLPGSGRTPAPSWISSPEDVADVVQQALSLTCPAGQFALAGISYGGYVAQRVLARDPSRVSGVALVVPGIYGEMERRDVPSVGSLVEEPGLEYDPAGAFASITAIRTAETLRRTDDSIRAALELTDSNAYERIYAGFTNTTPPAPAQFDGPSLVLTGRQDWMTGYTDAWRHFGSWSRTTFAVLDYCGHNLQNERPVLFNALVADWLDRLEEHLA